MVDNSLKTQAFKLKGRLYTFTVLQLLNCNSRVFEKQLLAVIAKAPRLFDKTPLVLDCSSLKPQDVDLMQLCDCLRKHSLFPVAVQTIDESLINMARSLGLAILNGSANQDKLLSMESPPKKLGPPVESIKNKLQTMPVRSGQQVSSKGDLVITASVSPGAELLAEGNIHVYGTLRGRALAGIGGNKQARIFCLALEAELVSIAGVYKMSDAMEASNKPCQIFLQDEYIQIESL